MVEVGLIRALFACSLKNWLSEKSATANHEQRVSIIAL
jgi:hypothetical protein